MYFYSLSGTDAQQRQIPVVHPVIDYSNVFNHSVFGGEFSYLTNFTSLSRQTAQFDAITTAATNSGICGLTSADPYARTPSQCLLRGVPGTYNRFTGEVKWRGSFTDSYGEIWTPFASVRVDAVDASIYDQPGVSKFINTGDTQALRVMPTVGLEYRYPFINVQPWGTTTIEPIAQVIVRPNESYAGKLPNEDAQSMVFGADNLFSVDKFSGYDRVEGGGRANVGVQATTQFDKGGAINVLFGQSYHLFGLNSYTVADVTNTGLDSGLDKPRSDYVARASYSPNSTYKFTTRARIDEGDLSVQRFEAEGSASFNRWSIALTYGNYAAQPALGLLTRREGLLGSGSVKVASNWVVSGGARWDLEANKINQYTVGAGYVDDCFVLALNYVTAYNYPVTTGNVTAAPTLNHTVMLQIGLRTIATTAFSQSVGGSSSGVFQ
jgi:LPS-assembly protein